MSPAGGPKEHIVMSRDDWLLGRDRRSEAA
jgi:hypothetical protein